MAPCSGRDSREKCRPPWPRQSRLLIAMLWVIRHSPYWPRSTEIDRVAEVIVRITEEREERRGRITGMGQTRLLPSTKIRWMPAAARDRRMTVPRGARTRKETGRGTAKKGRGMAKGSHGTATRGSGITISNTPMGRCRMIPAATTPSTPADRLSTRTGTAARTGARGKIQARRLDPHLFRV